LEYLRARGLNASKILGEPTLNRLEYPPS